MHFQYIDEAGSTGADLANPEQPVFIMASLIVSDEKWKKTERLMQEIIRRYFDENLPAKFELHSNELLSPTGTGPFRDHLRKKRNDLAKALLRLISERGHSIFLTTIFKERLNISSPPELEYGFDWKHPWQVSFDLHLTMFEEFLRSSRTGNTSTGLVIIDHEDDGFDFLRVHANARQQAKGWRELKKVVEIGYSVSSHSNPMIQLVDLIAYIFKKHSELKISISSKWPIEAREFYEECREIIWANVVFKNLSFQKLNTKESYIDFAKEIRKPKP
jgi:hypothetical protein